MYHGYCIRHRSDPDPIRGLTGIDGGEVGVITEGELVVWVSQGAAVPVSIARLHEHDRVVRSALMSETPLPLRFGSRFASVDDARRLLDARKIGFSEALVRVRGTVEMGLRITTIDHDAREADEPCRIAGAGHHSPEKADNVEPREIGPGRSYLETRRDEIAGPARAIENADQLLMEIETELADLGFPCVRTVVSEGGVLGSLAHLVQRKRIGEYRARIHTMRRHRGSFRIAPSGPWAPYSFVEPT